MIRLFAAATRCVVLTGLTVMLGCAGAGAAPEFGRERSAVVLIPGLGNGGTIWELKGYLEQFASHPRFFPAGHLEADTPVSAEIQAAVSDAYSREETPVFTLTFPDGGAGDIRESGRLLADSLTRLRLAHDAKSFTLVGKSLGGVIAREYLTSAFYAGDVARLVTISSPHSGSELAHLPEVYHWLKERSSDEVPRRGEKSEDGWIRRSIAFCEAQLDGIGRQTAQCLRKTATRAHWDVESVAVRMLLPPAPGNYLQELNERPHPKNVDYVCVVSAMSWSNYRCNDFLADWQQWRSGVLDGPCRTMPALTDLLRSTMHLCLERMNTSASAMAGDGVVSVASQDLNFVEAFARDPDLDAGVLRLSVGHHHVHHAFALATFLAEPHPLVMAP